MDEKWFKDVSGWLQLYFFNVPSYLFLPASADMEHSAAQEDWL